MGNILNMMAEELVRDLVIKNKLLVSDVDMLHMKKQILKTIIDAAIVGKMDSTVIEDALKISEKLK